MNEQPEALRLADALDRGGYDAQMARNMEKAAAELRRLHEENERLWKEREEPHKQIETYLLECNRLERERDSARAVNAELLAALKLAEAGLADIGDADREPEDDLAWCERRAAEPLPNIRAAIAKAEGKV